MSLARILADLAVRIAPSDRTPWAEAARAELDHVPSGEQVSFAAGALLAALRLRVAAPAFVMAAARHGLAAGAVVLAVLCFRLGWRLSGSEPSLPAAILTAAGGAWALGGLVTWIWGLRAARRLLPVALAPVLLYMIGAFTLLPESPNHLFYRALAIETAGALVWALLLMSAALRYARTSKHAR